MGKHPTEINFKKKDVFFEKYNIECNCYAREDFCKNCHDYIEKGIKVRIVVRDKFSKLGRWIKSLYRR